MLLLLMVIGYASIVLGSVWATVQSFRRAESFWGRRRLWICLAMSAELLYMLQAPGCVYLPKVPGRAVRRVLLGADAAHNLYRLEGTCPVAFVWGPRWWWVGSRIEFGIEVVPPLRYARRGSTRWELVWAQNRRPYPPDSHWRYRAIRYDGTLLAWGEDNLLELAPEALEWRVLAPLPTPGPPVNGPLPDNYLMVLQAVALAEDGRISEVYQDEGAFERSPRGTRRELRVVQRERSGREVARFSASLPEVRSPRNIHHKLDAAVIQGTLLVFELWREEGQGRGATYSVLPDGQAREINSFEVAVDEYDPVEVAATRDGAYFTTGQEVFRMRGEKVQDIEPMLSGCVWDGHTLYGIRRYPFLVSEFLSRENRLDLMLGAARHGIPHPDPGFGRRVRPIKAGWEAGHWVFGGLDESGREDEIVKVELP
jgi:hypothetical protein